MSMNIRAVWWVVAVLIVVVAAVLRLWHLDQLPRALYWEEVALGYDAYSILKTGSDHHGHPWPIIAFESFGDWKPSAYFYAAVPSIAIFGLNTWGVRLPSAIAGVGLVLSMGWLAAELRRDKKLPLGVILVSMGITALSPWALQFSRGAWEANLATLLITIGVASGWRWLRVSTEQVSASWKWLLVCVFSLIASMYAYHAARAVAPILGIMMLIVWLLSRTKVTPDVIWDEVRSHWQTVIAVMLLAVVMLLPFVRAIGRPEFSQRFNETNIFADLQLLEESQQLQSAAGNTVMAKMLYHRYILYGRQLLINAVTHLRFDFLFVNGDVNPRHSTQVTGLFFLFEVIPFLIGLVSTWRLRAWAKGYMVWWIGCVILTISLTKAVPHQLRLLVSLPAWVLIITNGWASIFDMVGVLGKRVQVSLVVVGIVVYVGFFAQYWRYYTQVYAVLDAGAFQYGYQQMINKVSQLASEQPQLPILISRAEGRPAMYYWFYTQTDPKLVQERAGQEEMDQGEFLQYRNVTFPVKSEGLQKSPAIVAITPPEAFFVLGKTASDQIEQDPRYTLIKNPKGEIVWVVYVNQ